MISLNGSIVLITGGAGAIGSCFTKGLLAEGAQVVILGRGSNTPISQLVDSIAEETNAHGRIHGYVCDTSVEEVFQNTLTKIIDEVGYPTVLINAAGGNKGKSDFVDIDVEIFDEVLQMNLIGGLVVPIKHISRVWIANRIKGSIINIASMTSYLPLSGVWAYSAAKSAVMNLTAGLAKEFAPHGIRINGIAPGFFVGNQNKDLLYEDHDNGILSERGQLIISRTPFGRFGSLEELNGTLFYLSSNNLSGFVTGVTIPVDGGYLVDHI